MFLFNKMPPKTIPKKYTAGLKGKEKKAQVKSIKEGKPRPKTSAKSKRGQSTIAFDRRYGAQLDKMKGGRSKKNIAKVTGIPYGALNTVYKKGEGAYFSSGSRPNQTKDSWGRARMYSYITGVGGSRKADKEVTKKYSVKF